MPELSDTTSELSAAITDILIALRETIKIVVAEVAVELTTFIKAVSYTSLYTTVYLLDDILELYAYEWGYVNQSIQELNNKIDTLIYNQVLSIDGVLNSFTVITDILLQQAETQLSEIDIGVGSQYNDRMFAIYGRIAEFSIAIDAPPTYLEEAIQNAKFFSMAIACSAGLSYYQFQINWSDGVERLLIRISNSIALYKQNPQWVKLDIEESLVKPIFDIEVAKRRQEKEQLTLLSSEIIDLQNSITILNSQTDENRQAVSDLFVLQIEPALKAITDNFNSWTKDIYDTRNELVDKSFVSLFLQIVEAIYEARRILGLLDFGGDILLRIDKLSDVSRIEQEDKISGVTTRTFLRSIPEWLKEVAKHRGK